MAQQQNFGSTERQDRNSDRNDRQERGERSERPMSRSRLSLENIKYDLLKISEPYDGIMYEGSGELVVGLFHSYLNDLCKNRLLYGFEIMEEQYRENAVIFDIMVQLTHDRNFRKIKVYVGNYKSAWPKVKHLVKQ
jgi:hypothetical protein